MGPSKEDRRELSWRAKLAVPEAAPPPWGLLGAGLALGAMLVCLLVIGPALASLLLGSDAISAGLLLLSGALGLALTSAFVLLNRRSSAASWQALRWGRGPWPLPITLLMGVAIALAIDLLVSLASGRFLPVPEIYGLGARGLADIALAALLLLCLQPLAETLVFQALLLPALRWRLGPWGGLLATSALFALLHLLVFGAAAAPAYATFWHRVAYPALLGLAFSCLKVYSGASGAVFLARLAAGGIFWLTALVLVFA